MTKLYTTLQILQTYKNTNVFFKQKNFTTAQTRNFTKLYKTLKSLQKQIIQYFTQFYKTLHNSTQLTTLSNIYNTLHIFYILQNLSQLHNILHILNNNKLLESTQLCPTLQHFSQLYNSCTTHVNIFSQLFKKKTLQKNTKLLQHLFYIV